MEDAVATLLDQFCVNNGNSLNLGSLVKVYISRASQLRSLTTKDDRFVRLSWFADLVLMFTLFIVRYNLVLVQTLNALFMLRCCLKQLVQTLTEENVIQQFVTKTEVPAAPLETGAVVVEQLVNSLIENIVDVSLE